MSLIGKNICSTNSSITLDPSKVQYIHIKSDKEVKSHAKTIYNVDTEQEEIVTQDYQSNHDKTISQNNKSKNATQKKKIRRIPYCERQYLEEEHLLKYSLEVDNILYKY